MNLYIHIMKRNLKRGKNKPSYSHFLISVGMQLPPYMWLDVLSILYLLSLICLAQTPVETFS